MSELKRMVVNVAVATVWTMPESPRELDAPALQRPVGLREWLESMTVDDRLDLCESNRVQSQLLYGTEVLAAEERGEWVQVLIPQQATPKNELGYPGWVPRCQLAEATGAPAGAKRAEVIADKAWLYANPDNSSEQLLELSFLTSLPVLDQSGEWIKVHTPEGGEAYMKADEVRLTDGLPAAPRRDAGGGHAGHAVVEQAKRFLGLPYLWGGLSSFGYDCSGFAYSMHKYAGVLIPRDASAQARHGQLVEREQLEPGDLLFFAYEEGKGAVHHVGIYAGDGQMIHSPESGKCIELVDLSSYRLAKEHCVSRRYV
ncbi:peptidase [Gordoniibacillus kamchatkensis]|uniref:Peptidase n=1 Tax=Gordoniibacillus kamchatkensis TaxID=1590651 RepID=A0ABR5AD57_9BACL|nr:NlpC/P60 family protein [Paenibacillus sp. VKM B-2647]KIL38942.1 peptidase [Paenibacillus sp. VKM B-2647]